jgi:hypothetical protein
MGSSPPQHLVAYRIVTMQPSYTFDNQLRTLPVISATRRPNAPAISRSSGGWLQLTLTPGDSRGTIRCASACFRVEHPFY